MRLTEENRITLNSFIVRAGFTTIAENFGVDVNQTNTYGETPLWVAAQHGQLDAAKILLEGGAEVNQANTYGETPLFIAAQQGQLAVAKLLIERKADVNQAMNDGTTPLHIATLNGQLAVAKLLIERKAEVNQAMTDGATPLHIAARNGQLYVAQLLIERGAKVNQAEATYGITPLWIAAQEGQLDVAQLLLEGGADVNQAMNHGATPLYIAAQQGHTTVTLLLKLAGAKRGAIDFDTNDEVIKQALKASAMLEIITQRFPESATDLHRAIEATLDNITNIDDLLSFNEGLERKFNKIIHPSSTADISHMVNQFLPGQLPDELIGKIANPGIENLAEHDLRGTINTEAIVAQIITDRLQKQAVQAPAQTAAATKIQALVRGRKGREEAQEVKAQTTQNEEPDDSWLFGTVEQHEVTVETGQTHVAMLEEPTAPMQAPEEREANATHVEMLAAQRQADSIKSCCTIS